ADHRLGSAGGVHGCRRRDDAVGLAEDSERPRRDQLRIARADPDPDERAQRLPSRTLLPAAAGRWLPGPRLRARVTARWPRTRTGFPASAARRPYSVAGGGGDGDET